MKFSIIIPIYNSEPFIDKSIGSILAQSYNDWEAICVNDSSPDNSVRLLNQYAEKDSRIKVITRPHRGLAATRNSGMEIAQGDYIIYLDPDDWLFEGGLQTIADNLEDNDMICFSGRKYFESSQALSEIGEIIPQSGLTGMEYFNKYSMNPSVLPFDCVWSRAYKRSLLVENAIEFKEGCKHEDYRFTPIACYYAKRVKVINECIYAYRIRQGSINTSQDVSHIFDYIDSTNFLGSFFIGKKICKSVIYSRLSQTYQIMVLRLASDYDKKLRKSIDWRIYGIVCRTKLRHIFNYVCILISPSLFRYIYKDK